MGECNGVTVAGFRRLASAALTPRVESEWSLSIHIHIYILHIYIHRERERVLESYFKDLERRLTRMGSTAWASLNFTSSLSIKEHTSLVSIDNPTIIHTPHKSCTCYKMNTEVSTLALLDTMGDSNMLLPVMSLAGYCKYTRALDRKGVLEELVLASLCGGFEIYVCLIEAVVKESEISAPL